MPNSSQILHSFSYQTRPSSMQRRPNIHLRIRRQHTPNTEIRIGMPCITNTAGHLTSTIIENIEFLLTYHQIHQTDAFRVTQRFNQFVAAVMVSTENGSGVDMDLYFTVTDLNSTATNRIDVDLLITDLHASNRAPAHEEESQDCPICLQTFSGREDVNSLPCHHIYHHECIATWIELTPSCPMCRQTAF